MKKLFLLSLSVFIFSQSFSQTKLGYDKEAQASFNYTKIDWWNDVQGVDLNMRINYSLLGNIIFRNSERFIIGDHIGCGFGIGYYKREREDIPLMVPFNLEFGAKTAFSVTDDLEIGVKYFYSIG